MSGTAAHGKALADHHLDQLDEILDRYDHRLDARWVAWETERWESEGGALERAT